jgi:hypothetical protein
MGNKEVEIFLSHLAVSRGVSAATQNQALCAIEIDRVNVVDLSKVEWLPLALLSFI